MGDATIMETQLRTASKLKLEIRMFLRAMRHVVSKHAFEELAQRTYKTLRDVEQKEVENDERWRNSTRPVRCGSSLTVKGRPSHAYIGFGRGRPEREPSGETHPSSTQV
jgi:hypothetical protein